MSKSSTKFFSNLDSGEINFMALAMTVQLMFCLVYTDFTTAENQVLTVSMTVSTVAVDSGQFNT